MFNTGLSHHRGYTNNYTCGLHHEDLRHAYLNASDEEEKQIRGPSKLLVQELWQKRQGRVLSSTDVIAYVVQVVILHLHYIQY
jgi:hypothetical protein